MNWPARSKTFIAVKLTSERTLGSMPPPRGVGEQATGPVEEPGVVIAVSVTLTVTPARLGTR